MVLKADDMAQDSGETLVLEQARKVLPAKLSQRLLLITVSVLLTAADYASFTLPCTLHGYARYGYVR